MNQLEVAKSFILMFTYHIKDCIFASYDIKQLLLNQSQMNETWPSEGLGSIKASIKSVQKPKTVLLYNRLPKPPIACFTLGIPSRAITKK